jgi:hypothetical protein
VTALRTACALALLADVAAAGLYAGVRVARWRPTHPADPPHRALADVRVDRCDVSPVGLVYAAGRVINPDLRGWRYVVDVAVTDTATGRLLEPLQAVVDAPPVSTVRWEAPASRRPVPADVGVTCRPAAAGRTPHDNED